MSEQEYFEGLDDKDVAEVIKEEIRNKYRLVFAGNEIGIEILADILINFCHFGCFLENAEQVAQYNVGINILSRMGIISKGNEKAIVQNLMNVLPNKEE